MLTPLFPSNHPDQVLSSIAIILDARHVLSVRGGVQYQVDFTLLNRSQASPSHELALSQMFKNEANKVFRDSSCWSSSGHTVESICRILGVKVWLINIEAYQGTHALVRLVGILYDIDTVDLARPVGIS